MPSGKRSVDRRAAIICPCCFSPIVIEGPCRMCAVVQNKKAKHRQANNPAGNGGRSRGKNKKEQQKMRSLEK